MHAALRRAGLPERGHRVWAFQEGYDGRAPGEQGGTAHKASDGRERVSGFRAAGPARGCVDSGRRGGAEGDTAGRVPGQRRIAQPGHSGHPAGRVVGGGMARGRAGGRRRRGGAASQRQAARTRMGAPPRRSPESACASFPPALPPCPLGWTTKRAHASSVRPGQPRRLRRHHFWFPPPRLHSSVKETFIRRGNRRRWRKAALARWVSEGGVWVLGDKRPSRPCRPRRAVGVSTAWAAVHASTLERRRLLQSHGGLPQVELVAPCGALDEASSSGGSSQRSNPQRCST